VLEEIEDDTGDHFLMQAQVAMPTKLFIKSKNPDHMDDTPTVNHVTDRKPMHQSLFKTKV
jgi:hypothetical protein